MLKDATVERLRGMKLNAMADAYLNPEPGSDGLSFEDRFALAVEREWYAKKNARTARLASRAGFSVSASIEGVEYSKGRNISRREVVSLGTCAFMQRKLNVIISGKTGSGKSYLACAIGAAACRNGDACRYYRLPGLFAELDMARFENRLLKFMDGIGRVPLLILDDMGLKAYSLEESRALLEIAEARYGKASMIVSSQIPHEKWYDLFPDPTLADAFMDRVVHNALVVALDSELSMREVMARRALDGMEV
jgi:DNA replication protein DnaC